ncbi:MAG: hypothetical protein AAGC93_12010 [Cyanobacteria bacterium P01_F01_bin.53]
MRSKPSSKILKRCGAILVAFGFLDLAITLYCTINEILYPSKFSFIAAVIAGGALLADNLRAATFVRWFSALGFGGLLTFILTFPFLQPLDLTLTYLRLEPATILPGMVAAVVLLVVLFWVCCELGRKPVQAAMRAARIQPFDIGIAAVLGVLLVGGAVAAVTFLLNGEDVGRIEKLAQQRLGLEYQYHVSSLNVSQGSRGTKVEGVITAWNENEIKQIPINWEGL